MRGVMKRPGRTRLGLFVFFSFNSRRQAWDGLEGGVAGLLCSPVMVVVVPHAFTCENLHFFFRSTLFHPGHAAQKMADPVNKLRLLQELKLAEMLKQVGSPCRASTFLFRLWRFVGLGDHDHPRCG